MSAGRIVLLVFGILIVIVSFGLIASGGVILAFDKAFKDEQGFYSTGLIASGSDAPVIISSPAKIEIGPGWFMRNRPAITVKVEGSSVNPSKSIFLGIAREGELSRYLMGVSYDELADYDFRSDLVNYIRHEGSSVAPPPTAQTFWLASSTGTGTQVLNWDVTSGSYSLVVMNADGSSPVNARVSLGIRLPGIVGGIGLGLLIGGIVLLVIGGVMIYFAARGW